MVAHRASRYGAAMDLMVHVTGHGDWTVVSIGGELDLSTAPRLRGELLVQVRNLTGGLPMTVTGVRYTPV